MMKISDDEEEEEDGGCCITEADAISEASLTLLQEAKEPFFATLMRGSSAQCSKDFDKMCNLERSVASWIASNQNSISFGKFSILMF